MKIIAAIGLIVSLVGMGYVTYMSTEPAAQARILLQAERRIDAGDPWQVTVQIPNATAGDTVQIILINGLQTLDTTVTLGTGGIAVWQVPTKQITQAGDSLLIVRYGELETRQTMQVSPLSPNEVDLFTTANTLRAYGEGAATIMMLPRDIWGNPPNTLSETSLDIVYPDGTQASQSFDYTEGLGFLQMRSQGHPGRVRLTLNQRSIEAAMELTQTAGTPQSILINVSPDCILADGRDLVTITATVQAEAGLPVTDGTLVTFTWRDGQGYAQTIDGVATLRMPVPAGEAWIIFHANVSEQRSEAGILRIEDGNCINDGVHDG